MSKWVFLIFLFIDQVRFYQNGTQVGSTISQPLNNLGPLDEIVIGHNDQDPNTRYYYSHYIGSIELYLKAMNSTQVASSMANSQSYFLKPSTCTDFN